MRAWLVYPLGKRSPYLPVLPWEIGIQNAAPEEQSMDYYMIAPKRGNMENNMRTQRVYTRCACLSVKAHFLSLDWGVIGRSTLFLPDG